MKEGETVLDEDSAELTDESYYEHPVPKPETQSKSTATDDLPG